MASSSTSLSYDVLSSVFAHVSDERLTLSRCALAHRLLLDLARKHLYRRVAISSTFDISDVPDVRALKFYTQFTASRLDQIAPHVVEFEFAGKPSQFHVNSLNQYYIIVGKFHDRWAGGNVGVALTAALPNYHNLQSLTLLGHKYQKNILPVIFANIHRAAALIHLTIASNCIEEESDFSLLDQLLSVRSLTILSPKNVILLPLPAWLEKLPQPLKELRLEDNCGSVTPGTLKFLIPHLPDLEVFTLGLSYSVKDEDLFPFLGKLTRLRQLQLTYYIQLGALPKVTISPSLVSFEVRYKMIHSRPHTNSLCTWVHQIIAHTSLESLELLCEDAEEYEGSGAHPSFDGLVKHLSVRHAKTLKTLRMEDAFVGTPAMVDLMSNCRQLEHLAVSVRENFIPQCTTFLPSMPRLRTIDIRIVNAKPQKVQFSIEQAQNFLRDGTSNLRQITVNGHGWKGEWCVQWDGDRPSAAFKLTEIQD